MFNKTLSKEKPLVENIRAYHNDLLDELTEQNTDHTFFLNLDLQSGCKNILQWHEYSVIAFEEFGIAVIPYEKVYLRISANGSKEENRSNHLAVQKNKK